MTSWVREAVSPWRRDFPAVWGLQISLGVKSDIVWVTQSIEIREIWGASWGQSTSQRRAPESLGLWIRLCRKALGRAARSVLPGPHFPPALDGEPPPLALPLWFGRCWVHSVDMPTSFQIYWNLIFTLGKVAPEWPFISLPKSRDTFYNLLVMNWLMMWFYVTF